MRMLKYFQLQHDLIYLALNFLGGVYDSLLFLFVRGTQHASRFKKRYGQKITKIKCKQKDSVICSWDVPRLLQRRLSNFVQNAEVVKSRLSSQLESKK